MCILWSLWAGPTNEWPDVAPPVGKKKTTFCEKITIFFNLRQTQQKFGAVTFLSISCDFCFSPSSLFLSFFLSFLLDRLLTKALLSQNDGRRWDRIHSIEKKVSKIVTKMFFFSSSKRELKMRKTCYVLICRALSYFKRPWLWHGGWEAVGTRKIDPLCKFKTNVNNFG